MASPAKNLRWILRCMLRATVVVVAVTMLLLVIVYGSLRSGLLSASLDRLITRLAQEEGVFFVRTEGVSGELPEHIVVRKVEIGDYYGVWLTIEDAEARWHPFDLFHPFDVVKVRVNVDDLKARRVVWTRPPEEGPDEDDDTPFRWDRFIRIIIGHIRVDELELTGSLLDGDTARVSAEGSGILGEWERGFVKLDIEHVDDTRGTASIDLKTGGTPLELSGTITADEGPGGVLAALARQPEAGAVLLDVSASGPMRDWHAEAHVDASRTGALHVDVKLAFTAEGPFELTGSFDPVAEQRERWLVGEGAPMSLYAKGAWAPDVQLRLDSVRLVADGRELSAGGRLDLATLEFDAKARVAHQRDGEVVVTTLGNVTEVNVDGRGELRDGGKIAATLDAKALSLEGVFARELRVKLDAADAPGAGVPTFTLAASADGLALDDAPVPLLGEQVRLTAGGRVDLGTGTLVAESVNLVGGALTVEGPLSFGDEWSSMKALLQADASSLESLGPLVEMPVAGTATALFEIVSRSNWQDLEVKVRGKTADVVIGEAGWNALLGGASKLDVNFEGAPRGPASGDLMLQSTGIDATATAKVGAGGEGLEGNARFVLDNLSRLAEPTQAAIAGHLEATATARGSLEDFDVAAQVRGDRFSWEGLRFDSLTADVGAAGLPSSWTGSVRSHAKYGELEASLDADVSMPEDGRVVVRDLVLRGPRTEGSANLEVDLERYLASGTLRLKSEDLALWRPMTGLGIGGEVNLEATLGVAPEGGRDAATQRISATAAIRHGVLPVDGTELFIDALDLVAEDLEVGPRPRGTARVQASRLRYGDRTLVEGTATAAGDGRLWNIATMLDVRNGEPIVLDAAGTVLPGPPIEITLARALGSVGHVALELVDPASLRLVSTDATQWSTGPVALRIGESGRLDGQAAATNGRTRIDAQARELPLTIVSLFSPELDLQGTVDGKLQLEGSSLATATGELSLRGRDVASHGLEDQGVSPVDVQADARFGSGRVKAAATLEGLSETRLAVTLDAPLDAASGSAPFVAGLVWKGNLAETLVLLPLGEDSLTGRIDADLELTGTINSPRVTGRAVIDGGQWEQADTGLVLRDIRAELEGSGTSLTLTSLTATDGQQGRIRANGRLRFGTLPGFDAQFDLEATDAMLARLDIVTARADATLSLAALRSAEPGAAIEGSITGNVQIDEARIAIPQRFVADIPEIDVIVVGTETDAAAIAASGKTSLQLDVAVEANNRIFVTGRGLESEWASDLHVRGTTLDPRIEGKITSVRGELSLLGRRFDVRSATLLFDGKNDNVPWLTMTARAEANDITAIAEVSGLATRPSIELRSEPSLPRDEVLSRVLFGQSAANLTPLQSVQLARSVAELAGSPLGGGGGLLTDVGRTLGFDSLGLESSGSDGAAALTASKYLTDTVYLRVQGGLTPESSRLSLEWRVFKNIILESDVSQDAQGEVGATWRWDY